jgi:cysteinyl-tRNA synthetase
MRLYNTASKTKEEFTLPAGIEQVRLYCCGPTVYHYAHIGNLRTYIFEDLLRRTLQYHGFAVNHIVNITDVGHLTSDSDTGEDKMEKGARRTGKSVWEIAQFYTDAFMQDFKRLNLTEPVVWCKATDHIPQQIRLVKALEAKGFTYQTSDGVYFDSRKFNRYGDFARLDIEGLQEGSRIEIGEKKFATDFALWKFSPKDELRAMEWDSPWGVGFPGWHIECSAMAMHYLGDTLDIHCGGTDHIRIHHTNEIAQSECATGHQYCRFWMHGEFLRMGESGKMSKSNDDFLTLQLLIDKGYSPMDYRYMALTSHYRNYLNFSWEALDSARDSLKSLKKKTLPLADVPKTIESDQAKFWLNEFINATGDDLNIPKSLGLLNQVLKDNDLGPTDRAGLCENFDTILGLNLFENDSRLAGSQLDAKSIESYIQQRNEARLAKNFALSDQIRDQLLEQGVLLKDSPEGTLWQFKN